MLRVHPVNGKLLVILILLAIFVVPGSISGTAIALPAIAIDTNAPLTSLQWVVNAFNLTFACLTLAWGALADGIGRKRCFLIGVATYSVASLVSALAPNALILDLGRALAGVGAAAVFSCGIAILSTNFDGAVRIRVFALFGTVAGLGVSLGPTISGILLDLSGWRTIFYVHAIILFVVLTAQRIIPMDTVKSTEKFNFDFRGALLFICALFIMMLAIVQSSQWGWENVRTLCLVIAAIMLFGLFWLQERRYKAPMLDLSLLASGPFVGYSLITVAGSFGFVTLLTYFPTYVTSVLKMSATNAGLVMLFLTTPMLICPLAAGKAVGKGVSANVVLIASLICLLSGLAVLALVSAPSTKLVYLCLPLLLIGVGFGLAAGLVDGLALQTVPEEKAGMGAGLLNTFRLGSEAVAVSLYGSILTSFLFEKLQPGLSVFNSNSETVRQWVNDVAAGNIENVLAANTPQTSAQMNVFLSDGYNGSFHEVLWLLFGVVAILTGVIGVLIRRKSELTLPCVHTGKL